jgi:hypothetical protein
MPAAWYELQCKTCGFNIYVSVDPSHITNYLVQCSFCRHLHDLRDPLRLVEPSETGHFIDEATGLPSASSIELSYLCKPYLQDASGASAAEQMRAIANGINHQLDSQCRSAEARGITLADDLATQQMNRFTRAMQPLMCLFAWIPQVSFRRLGSVRGTSLSVVQLLTPRWLRCGQHSAPLLVLSPTATMMYAITSMFLVCWFLVRFIFWEFSPLVLRHSSWLATLTDASVAVTLAALWRCCLMDPGYILPGGGGSFETPSGASSCSVCKHVKPIRAHHCYLCGVCVYEHDHHCQVTGCCVGKRNLRPFFVFCVAASIATACGCAVSIDFFVNGGAGDSVSPTFATTVLGVFAVAVITPMALALPILVLTIFMGAIRNLTQRERKRPELLVPTLQHRISIANLYQFLFRSPGPAITELAEFHAAVTGDDVQC